MADLSEYQRARLVGQGNLSRYRRELGADHPDALRSAHTLAIVLSKLGNNERARQLSEDTLARYQRVLGEDHPDSLNSAHTLTFVLRGLVSTSGPAGWARTPWPATSEY